MSYPYTPPAFLQNETADGIHRRMMEALPPGIDKSENNIPWDYTRPSALEKSRFVQRELNETIRLIFPQWSYDEWLDLHAEKENIKRKPATKASGILTVTGIPGTVIPAGFQFATPANLTASVIFETTQETILNGTPDARGQVTANIPIQAAEGGIIGNVTEDTIKLMLKPLGGVSYITNREALTGGIPEESDESLIQRVLESMRLGMSFTGCDADYVRWAKEVPGVGQAFTQAEWDDSNLPDNFLWVDSEGNRHKAGAVRLFIIDGNGVPANQTILDLVHDHIISPNDRMQRLAPIGATLTVTAPSPIYIFIEATVTLKEDANIQTVTDRFKANLDLYWLEATTENDLTDVQSGLAENYVKYVYIGAALARTAGIANYSDLTINGGTADILIPIGQFPVTQEVVLSE